MQMEAAHRVRRLVFVLVRFAKMPMMSRGAGIYERLSCVIYKLKAPGYALRCCKVVKCEVKSVNVGQNFRPTFLAAGGLAKLKVFVGTIQRRSLSAIVLRASA